MGRIIAAAGGANYRHMIRLLKAPRSTVETHARTNYAENARNREAARGQG